MSAKYSNTELHRFIKEFTELRYGELIEKSDEVFTIRFPHSVAAKEYTYQPVVAREQKIPLITTGSPALEGIIKECLNTGAVCSILMKSKQAEVFYVTNYFKDRPFKCDNCDLVAMGGEQVPFCVKSPPCYHKINNARISSTKITNREEVRFFQFYFSVIFKNKLSPKCEESITLLMDEQGNFYDCNVLEDKTIEIVDCQNTVERASFDRIKILAYKKLDTLLEEKLAFFDLQIRKDMRNKLRSYDKRLREERRQKLFSKREFDENEWQTNRDILLKQEEESYKTRVSVRFLNLLVIRTYKIHSEITLDNGSIIVTSFIIGVTTPQVFCPICQKTFFEGYATEDHYYVCNDCVKQSIETGKLYSKDYALFLDPTLGEYMEQDVGFICSVCGKRNSRLLEYKCAHDGSSVCIYHYSVCDICHMIFSERNLQTSQLSGRQFCPEHFLECDACGSIIGLDEYRTCKASGKNLCPCTAFVRCKSCQQEYSPEAMQDNRCPACNNMNTSTGPSPSAVIETIRQYDPDKRKTTKWLIGENKLNTVVVAKGFLSSTLYVVENNAVVFKRNISMFEKIRGG